MKGPYRDGKVHVHARQCATCIFRPGDLMHLAPGRVTEMVREARANWSVIPCHETLEGDESTCAGYASLRPQPDCLQVAERLGILELVEPPAEWNGHTLPGL